MRRGNEALDRLRDRYDAMFDAKYTIRTRTNSLLDVTLRVLKLSGRAGNLDDPNPDEQQERQ